MVGEYSSSGGMNLIFLILGTQKFQLNRLLRQVDELYEKGQLDETVFAQIGHSDYKPKNYDYVEFLDRESFEVKIKESSLVITALILKAKLLFLDYSNDDFLKL